MFYEYWGNSCFKGQISMALEEYMLKRAAESENAQIRFYSFPHDTIVLGYAQATDVILSSVDVVRRATGGSHVQTGKNILSYSFAAPRNNFSGLEDMRKFYAECVANTFRKLGIENVEADNKASSVNINGKVSAAHAMIWGVESGLLHGLILIDPYEMEKLARRIYLGTRIIGSKVYSDYDAIKNIPTISELLPNLAKNSKERTEALKKIICETILKEVTGGRYENRIIDDKVINVSLPLLEKRYGQNLWTNSHNPVFTKEEIDEIPGEELDGPLKEKQNYCMYLQVKNKDYKKMTTNEN